MPRMDTLDLERGAQLYGCYRAGSTKAGSGVGRPGVEGHSKRPWLHWGEGSLEESSSVVQSYHCLPYKGALDVSDECLL